MQVNTCCTFCHQPVDPGSRYTYQRVTGWERKALNPSRKHGSDIMLRESVEEWAHAPCVGLAKQGLLGQESLLSQ
jgi:hypothetical protein